MVKKLKIPYGFQDFLPDECYNKDRLEICLSDLYKSYGYYKTETPTIEYYDTFHDVYEPDKLKKMFKLTDSDGSLLALRPDITLQICRMASQLDSNSPQRLYYTENCFEYLDNLDTARTREFSQIGVELLGKSGLSGDIEIVALAVESLLKAGLKDFVIEVGNHKFFGGMISDSNLSENDINKLISLINKKNKPGIKTFLNEQCCDNDLKICLLNLPALFGKNEIFATATQLPLNEASESALKETEILYDALKRMGYESYISVDLGMLHGYNYYSGLVMRGFSKGFGLSLMDGGRYDGLCPSFGNPAGAVGFAIGIKRLLSVLDKGNMLCKKSPCDHAYYSDEASIEIEASYVHKLREDGFKVVKLFTDKKEELISYCIKNGIKKAFSILGCSVNILDAEVAGCHS